MLGNAEHRGEELANRRGERDLRQLAAGDEALVEGAQPGIFRTAVRVGIQSFARSRAWANGVSPARSGLRLPEC